MEALKAFIDEQRAAWDVPGCAVVAVKGDEIVLNQGFGLRDVSANLPVTNRTLFAIGSTTKAFTAAAVGAMVDDGLIDWETPIRDYLPEFRLHDDEVTSRITAIDILSHRTGLPRHEFIWIGHPERSRADLVRRLRYLPLSRDIRQTFQYCNLGFVTAGYLVERITGMSWEDYVASRLLKPLGMDGSNFSSNDSMRTDDYSKPYQLREGKVVEINFRPMDAAGPAGSISSCTDDMARWLRVNLGAGRIEDEQVISPATIHQLHTLQMHHDESSMFPESTRWGYGLGWMIGQYRGRRIVEHGGGIDGSLTECMMLPNEGIGVVVLTNQMPHMLGPVIAYQVLDTLLGEEPIDWATRYRQIFDASMSGGKQARAARPVVEGATLPRPVEEYVGDYANDGYGTFSITADGDTLVPSFGNLNLALKHRHFDVFDLEWRELSDDYNVFPLTFLTSPDGEVSGLVVPFEGSITFERQADARGSDPTVLAKLCGAYEMGPIEIVVGVKAGQTLTVQVAGGPSADLAPGRGLKFSVKEQPGTTLEFVLSPDDTVEKIVVQPMGVFTPK